MDMSPEFATPAQEPSMKPIEVPQHAQPVKAAPAVTKISVKNLNFYYSAFQALHDINIEIPEKRSRR